jgi:hypothetical protein
MRSLTATKNPCTFPVSIPKRSCAPTSVNMASVRCSKSSSSIPIPSKTKDFNDCLHSFMWAVFPGGQRKLSRLPKAWLRDLATSSVVGIVVGLSSARRQAAAPERSHAFAPAPYPKFDQDAVCVTICAEGLRFIDTFSCYHRLFLRVARCSDVGVSFDLYCANCAVCAQACFSLSLCARERESKNKDLYHGSKF